MRCYSKTPQCGSAPGPGVGQPPPLLAALQSPSQPRLPPHPAPATQTQTGRPVGPHCSARCTAQEQSRLRLQIMIFLK